MFTFTYPAWRDEDVFTFNDSSLCNFLDLKGKFTLLRTSFFLYLRLRSAIKNLQYMVPWDSPSSSRPVTIWFMPSLMHLQYLGGWVLTGILCGLT